MKLNNFKFQISNLKLNKSGFTLIELLVVIGIIGLLATLLLARFSRVEKTARDMQRKSDLNQYRVALEAYAGQYNGVYPHSTPSDPNGPYGGLGTGSRLCQTGDSSIFVGGLYSTYLNNTCLFDPNPDNSDSSCGYGATSTRRIYCYGAGLDGLNYVLTVRLETGGFYQVCSTGKVGIVSAPDLGSLQAGTCQVP